MHKPKSNPPPIGIRVDATRFGCRQVFRRFRENVGCDRARRPRWNWLARPAQSGGAAKTGVGVAGGRSAGSRSLAESSGCAMTVLGEG